MITYESAIFLNSLIYIAGVGILQSTLLRAFETYWYGELRKMDYMYDDTRYRTITSSKTFQAIALINFGYHRSCYEVRPKKNLRR